MGLQILFLFLGIGACIIIQRWFRRYLARLELKRRCTWNLYTTLEYAEEQDLVMIQSFYDNILGKMKAIDGSEVRPIARSQRVVPSTYVCVSDYATGELDPWSIPLEEGYVGPEMVLPMSMEFFKQILNYAQRLELIPARYVVAVIMEAAKICRQVQNVQFVNTEFCKEITIIGDLHGNFMDFLTILDKNGLPSVHNRFIFNGDLVDRGCDSIEVLFCVCLLMVLYPNHVHINRGNHEDPVVNKAYGFTKEIRNKYKETSHLVRMACDELFCVLPLAVVINRDVLVIHGGVSAGTDLNTLCSIRRHRFKSILNPVGVEGSIKTNNDPEWKTMLDITWSDPQTKKGSGFNRTRGCGCTFGPDITAGFLQRSGLSLIIRSHECCSEGYEWYHGESVLTLFSCSDYFGPGSNLGAFLKFYTRQTFRVVQFRPKSVSTLSLSCRIGMNERAALKALKDRILFVKDKLQKEFLMNDPQRTGKLPMLVWAETMERVLQNNLSWILIAGNLEMTAEDNFVEYRKLFDQDLTSTKDQALKFDSVYEDVVPLEALFQELDLDSSGKISMEEMTTCLNVLHEHLISDPLDCRYFIDLLDKDKDGMININEFFEAFRLTRNRTSPLQ